jgi:DNA-binding GntR family transcriptional regulator
VDGGLKAPIGNTEESRIAAALADAIFEHRLPPGTKLPEADLCRIFDVSRGVVRKALSRLAGEQLLDLVPNRGAFVAKPSVEETRNVYELRRILETGVIRSLRGQTAHASKATPRLIGKLREQVAEEREANRIGDTPRYIRLAGQFHLDLAAITGNAALVTHIKRLIAQTSLMIGLYDVSGSNTCSFHEHLEILAAIEKGRYEEAEKLMDEHIVALERQLRLDEKPRRIDLHHVFAAVNSQPASA